MAYSSFNNSNVKFLQGTQSNLNALITSGGAIEGAFYLTYDTHRLYIGRNNGTSVIPVAVNEGVTTVANVAALSSVTGANAGEFYYATEENILCVYNGQNFIQINTDKDTKNSSLTTTASAQSNVATVTHALIDSDNSKLETSFTIKDSSGNSLITVNGTAIDIKTDTYTLSAESDTEDTATITLNSENTESTSQISLVAGSNISIEVGDDDNEITISSSYENTTIASDGVKVSLTDDGKVKVDIKDSKGTTVSGTSSDAIEFTIDSTSYTPGDTLPVYTQKQVDDKFVGLNGMTYKGTVGSTALPERVEIGWTYLVNQDGVINISTAQSYDGVAFNANKGDLLIATGTEDSSGYITAETLKWSYVPSGDDASTDTRYETVNTTTSNKMIIREDSGDNTVIGGIQVIAGEEMAISSAEGSDGELKVTVNHAEVTSSQTTGTAKTGQTNVTAVTKVVVNDFGHVTDVETTSIGIRDTTYSLEDIDVDTIEKGVQVTYTLADSNNGQDEKTLDITSDTLKITAGTLGAGYTIEMQWGSF